VETARASAQKAREHLAYSEANASEQRELRLVEAQRALAAAESELTLEEGRLADAHAAQEAAQYAYDVCMGFITPEPDPEPAMTFPVVSLPPSMSPQTARSWQSALDKMATAARIDIEFMIANDLEDVSLVCVRLEECQSGHWVTVGPHDRPTTTRRR
jgi:hypothetical protein